MDRKFFKAFFIVLAVLVVTVVICAVSPAQAQSAKGQLNSIGNTGKVFDGSDGKRSGMDVNVQKPTGNIPEVPKPTRVETSTGTAGGYTVGGSTTTVTGTASGSSAQSGKTTTSSQSGKTTTGKTGKTGSESAK